MRSKIILSALVGLTMTLSGCAVTSGSNDGPSEFQVFDPELIPMAPPADATPVDPMIFDIGNGEYGFKAGGGPTWCSINVEGKFAICEHSEPDAIYDELPVPKTCDLSFGYQFRLHENEPAVGEIAEITCASALYADPSLFQTLIPGETLTVGGITCFVSDITARCDNTSGNFIVLGQEVWAKG